ncbi:MAG: succinate dehydrogenase assembly factor 2 [Alphaproteobacteria bacterium]|nr:succinate dehydrogenase assembly factor 2 [Alphaproteobacteria bacterium]
MTCEIDDRRKRILYRARYRGFREADFLFGGFAEAFVGGMTVEELDEFEALLAMSDHDVYGWVTGEKVAPANVEGPMLDRMRAFDVSALTRPRDE